MKPIYLLIAAMMSLTGLTAKNPPHFIPQPVSVTWQNGTYSCATSPGITVTPEAKKISKELLVYIREKGLDRIFSLSLHADPAQKPEGYSLHILPDKIKLSASDAAGLFYGFQTLLQCCPPEVYKAHGAKNASGWTLPCLIVEDYPRFSWRGMHLDVSRQFFDVGFIKKYLDWMAAHKLNTFHWHLTDDNGWRIEIKKYPDLCLKGAFRGPDQVLPPSYGSGFKCYGGYYTQDQIRDIVRYAALRHITVIPEIDLPGHAKAAMASYPQWACTGDLTTQSVHGETANVWCVTREKNYEILDHIIKELAALFPGPYIHVGGDEVNTRQWENCSLCKDFMHRHNMEKADTLQDYFMNRVTAIVAKYGKKSIGWNEILQNSDLDSTTIVHVWQHAKYAKQAAERGLNFIFQPAQYLYFDMKHTPYERGHFWAAIVPLEKVYQLDPMAVSMLTEEESHRMLGIQGGLWAELLDRPDHIAEYQSYPRICALSEVAWTPQALRCYEDFDQRLTHTHLDRLLHMGIHFRVPIPTVTWSNGYVIATSPYPWMAIRYTTDQSKPTLYSPLYQGPLPVSLEEKPHHYRFACFYKDRLQSQEITPSVDYSLVYQSPATTVTASFETSPKTPLSLLADYNPATYIRCSQRLRVGDWLEYRFTEPVLSPQITFATGIPNLDVYLIDSAQVYYTIDGNRWAYAGNTQYGSCTFCPPAAIRGVRIIFDKGSFLYNTCIRDLTIEK